MLEVWRTSISPPGWCRTRPRAVLGWKDIWKVKTFFICDPTLIHVTTGKLTWAHHHDKHRGWWCSPCWLYRRRERERHFCPETRTPASTYVQKLCPNPNQPVKTFVFLFWQIPISLRPLVSALSYKFIRRGLQTDHVCCWNLLILKGRKAVPNRMNFQKSSKGRGVGSFSIQKFILQILGLFQCFFSDVFRKKIAI